VIALIATTAMVSELKTIEMQRFQGKELDSNCAEEQRRDTAPLTSKPVSKRRWQASPS
jgi:hypothetical protein